MNRIYILLVAIVLNSCEGSSSADKTTSETKTEEAAETWSYGEYTDQMNGDKKYYATCVSTNTLEFEFPYAGGSTFELAIRHHEGKGSDVRLEVSKGQFMPSIMNSEYVRVKFDDGEAAKFSYSGTDDGSATIIFLNNEKKFINKLKTAKKLMIEAPFYQAGRQIIQFDVEGLKWDY